MNLFSEYRRRVNIETIGLVEEGVCFFQRKNIPSIIATVSSHSKSSTTCSECVDRQTLIVEIHSSENFVEFPRNPNFSAHIHVRPDADLIDIVRKAGFENLSPVISKGKRDQEIWLWNFFLKTKPLSTIAFKKMMEDCKETRSHAKAIEQMLWTCRFHHPAYAYYYNKLYLRLLLGRKYILTC